MIQPVAWNGFYWSIVIDKGIVLNVMTSLFLIKLVQNMVVSGETWLDWDCYVQHKGFSLFG